MLHSVCGEDERSTLSKILKLSAKVVAFEMQWSWGAFDRSDGYAGAQGSPSVSDRP